jgi:hypothetical protein
VSVGFAVRLAVAVSADVMPRLACPPVAYAAASLVLAAHASDWPTAEMMSSVPNAV